MSVGVVQLVRLPARRDDRKRGLRPLLGTGAWPAAVATCEEECRAAVPAKFRGVLALLLVLLEDCERNRRGWSTMARSTIADRLGLRGKHAEETVRRRLRAAEELGELVVVQQAGDHVRSDGRPWHGVPTHKLIPTRLLPYLTALPRDRRLEVLRDEHVAKAIELREALLSAAIATNEASAVPANPGAWRGLGVSPVSSSLTDPSLSNVSEITARVEGAAPAEPRGAVRPAGAMIEPDGPANGPPAPPSGAEARPGAGWRALEARVRDARDRLRELLDEIAAERHRLAHGLAPGAPRGWHDPETEGRAALAAERARAREAASLAKVIQLANREIVTAARFAESQGRKAGRSDVFTSAQEHRRQSARFAAELAGQAEHQHEAPAPWRTIWRDLFEHARHDSDARALSWLAQLAVVRAHLDGDELVLVVPEGSERSATFLRDRWSDSIGAAARRADLSDLTIRIVDAR